MQEEEEEEGVTYSRTVAQAAAVVAPVERRVDPPGSCTWSSLPLQSLLVS